MIFRDLKLLTFFKFGNEMKFSNGFFAAIEWAIIMFKGYLELYLLVYAVVKGSVKAPVAHL